MEGQSNQSTSAHLKMIGKNMMHATHSFYDKFYANIKHNTKTYLTYISISLVILITSFIFMHIHVTTHIWQTVVLGLIGLIIFYNAWIVNFVMDKDEWVSNG